MRTVLGVVVAVVLAVVLAGGCGSEPSPIEPMCPSGAAFASCVEGMVATCEPERTEATFVNAAGCAGAGVVEGTEDYARCNGDVPTCDSGGPVTCVEAPSLDPDDCARWAEACAEMGETSCYVPAGTDDVFPY